MPFHNIVQPEIIGIEPELRLKRFDGNLEAMIAGYQDPVVYQNSEGIFDEDKIPDRDYIQGMCKFLEGVGELYFIQVLQNGEFVSVGDVTVKPENPPIAIWQERYRGVGIGSKVMRAVIRRLSCLGYEKITGTSVFKWNTASQKMHEKLGFCRVGETEKEYIYSYNLREYASYKMLFFDLDGTLLNSQKCISNRTAQALAKCKEKGLKIGVCTSRSEVNSLVFIGTINPDIIISSGGSLVKAEGRYIYKNEFDVQETRAIIQKLREQIGEDCEITVDTVDTHYWNYKVDPSLTEANWGDSVYDDFSDFCSPSLKICVEIRDESKAESFYSSFCEYDCIRFSDGNWYKLTKKNSTKESAIQKAVACYGCKLDEIISFGDDYADIGMLKMSGLGVAMGNALDVVKEAADCVIGTNDEDGIAVFLEERLI